MADETIFSNEEAPNLLSTLVGEDKKFKTPEDLAKSKIEADNFIESLKRETQELRTERERLERELQDRGNVEDQLKRFVENQGREPRANSEGRTPDANVTPPQQSRDELVRLIREVTDQNRTQERQVSNVNQASAQLATALGGADKARDAVKAKAAELGVSVEFLQEVAAKSPVAFLKQFDVDQNPRSTPNATHGNVNTEALRNNSSNTNGPKPGTYAYYTELRRSNPNTYFSPQVQVQLHKDAEAALERGEDFFS